VARGDFRNMEESKKDRLLRLAKDMKDIGYPKEFVCEAMCNTIAGQDISESTIRRYLPDEFKNSKQQKKASGNQTTVNADKKHLEESISGAGLIAGHNGTQQLYSENTFVVK